MKVDENHTHLWDIFVLKREDGLYSIFQKWTPHISVLQREINCLNKENKNQGFWKIVDFDLQITYQSHYFDENMK